MPFVKHPRFWPAPKNNSLLWRYLSLPKFLFLLQRKELFFANLELMAQEDPFEGALPASSFKHRKWKSIEDIPKGIIEKLERSHKFKSNKESAINEYTNNLDRSIRQAFAYRRSLFINCWHLSNHESAAMWDIYSRRSEGVAILSTEERIKMAFSNNDKHIMGGRVNYEDYSDNEFELKNVNVFDPVIHKRNSFSYENEYRLVYWDNDITHNGDTGATLSLEDVESMPVKPGHAIDCKLDELIEAVYISPLTPKWLHEVIKELSSAYSLKAPVYLSALLNQPMR